MLLNFLAVIAGFGILIWGADRFVIGASATARNLGVPPLIIGLTVVGFGTSAPEMLVSGLAAWYGNPGISVGNAIGSNIANIGLVIGATALVAPISVHSNTLRREFPLLFVFMVLALLLLVDGYLSRWDGVILIMGMFVMLYWITRIALRSRTSDPMQAEFADEIPLHMPMWKAGTWLLVGLVLLLAGSRLVVFGAVEIAHWLGISDLIIGLTVIAIGTSLPELAASIMCILKKEDDIAVGNVVGSNMFNLLGVMGIPGLIAPFQVPAEALSRDFGVMFALTIALFAMSYGFGHNGVITRFKGAALVVSFLVYLLYLYLDSI
jgi:cation:H+ antiporter